MSFDFSSANIDRLLDDSYAWYLEASEMIPTVYQRVADTTPPPGFDPSKPYYRGQVGVMDVNMQDLEEGEEIKASGIHQDFPWQMKRRKKGAMTKVTPEAQEAGERAVIDFIKEFVQKYAAQYEAELDLHVANMFNYGMLTTPTDASIAVFDQTVSSENGFPDPSSTIGLIYDSYPWFDTAHPLGKYNTGTTKSNHEVTTYSVTISNLEAYEIVMRDTNAYDSNGQKIVVQPNQLIYPPALKYTIEKKIGTPVIDADQEPNIVGKQGWEMIEWPRLSNAAGWFMMEARKDLVVIRNWKPTFIHMWQEDNPYAWCVSASDWFGAAVRGWRRSACLNVDAS